MKKKKVFELRGRYINMLITFIILLLIIIGTISSAVASNLEKLSTLIIGFFTVSYGVWQTKSYFEGKDK